VIALDLRSGVERLGDMIAEASTIVPFTGAGISTECGIPDFRSPGGLWTSNRPIPFDEFVASQDARDEAWRRRFAMEPTFAAARHAELEAEMERLSQYGKSAKKPQAVAPAPKAKKRDEKKSDAHHDEHHSRQVTEPVADAA